MSTIKFRDAEISTDEARAMIDELSMALADTDPATTDSPIGQPVLALVDPRWYTEVARTYPGTCLSFRDPALGWRSFLIPWAGVADLMGLLARQMAFVSARDSQPPKPPGAA